jgi:heme O synthase-like polyprenyltransferase
MRWQDIVISICQTSFLVALVPSIKSNHKPAVTTSVMYAILLCVIAFSLATLHLWLSAITALAGAVPWFILALQKHKQGNVKKPQG